jgi:transketolase
MALTLDAPASNSAARHWATAIRQIILRESKRANVGHIGSALCVADIIATVYAQFLRASTPTSADRDRFLLSKGHAALALYAALYLRGWLTESQLATYCSDGTLLGVHPERDLTGVDFSTGSLGQGLSTATGAALAARLQHSDRRVYVLVSDAECNEGSLWESIMFAAHHRLANLVAIVDLNGQQALGYTRDVLNLSPLSDRWRAFGWDVHDVDGHNIEQLSSTLSNLDTGKGPPHVLLAKTVFGCGVSFMESQIKWHYLPLTNQEYDAALAEVVTGGCAAPSYGD